MNSLQNKVRLIENQYNSGDFDGAEVKAKELIKEYSKFPYLYNFYGTILDKQNKFDEAILAYKTAIKLKPNYFEVYFNMGNLFMRNKNAEKQYHFLKKL